MTIKNSAKKRSSKKSPKKGASKRSRKPVKSKKQAKKSVKRSKPKKGPRKAHKSAKRKNPARVDLADGGRVLRPENCPLDLSSALLRARKSAKKKHQRKPRRWGNCDYRSAEYVLSKGKYLAKRGITPGSNFKGSKKSGKHAGAKVVTGRGDSMVSWWWLGSK